MFKVRRDPRSAYFYSPGQVGSCQDNRIYGEKITDTAFSSWVGRRRLSRVLPKPYKAIGLGERHSEGS